MAEKWTDEQRQAIEASGGDLLVAAAAGSGKTAVLVERIITKLLQKEQEIDRLLVVTFTNAAAAEMRQRIGAALAGQLQETPNDLHLQNQIAFLPKSDIKTIHAFCLQVIREYYHLLELDPKARTADPAEIKLLQKEVLEELFETLYAAEDSRWFFDLLEAFAPSTKDTPLRELVLRVYEFAQGSPNPERLLEEMAESLSLPEGKTVDACVWFPLLRRSLADAVEYALYQLRKAERMATEGEFDGYHKLLANEAAALENFAAALTGEYAEWRLAYLAIDFARLPAYRGEQKETAERIKALRTEAKNTVKKIQEVYFAYSPKMQAELVRRIYPVAKGLARLTRLFMDAFAAAKREKNIIDFHDYEQFALKILVHADGTPTAAAAELRGRYDEIMIDEYQDSNPVQEMILSAVSGESEGLRNRFMVGDVKQSIYRFRQAMPELFNEKYQRYSAEEGQPERKIVLSRNFRSRKNILDGVNFIFRQIMQQALGDIAYDDAAALYAGREFPDCEAPHGGENEMLLLATAEMEDSELSEELLELDRRQVEATAIVARIRTLLESGYQVLDKKTGAYRPLRYGDIAVLLRSMKNWSSVLEDVFGRAGLPYYAETAEGYFEVPEVETVLHLLRLLDNPRQDIPLLSILHSPIYGFSAEELIQLRLQGGKGAYYDLLRLYLQKGEDEALRERVSDFLSDLFRWRERARDISLHELLRLVYRETGYYDYLSVTAGGALRQANLRLLLEKTEEYENGSHRGLFYFIRYVEDLKTAEAETSSAKLPTEGEERIRVMTIHKSKGLEFPVVFVSDMGKSFNELDLRSAVLLHRKWGCGMDAVDIEKRVSYRTLAKRALAEAIKEENLAEEMRVLYVALTRAKEKLILTGTVKDLEKACFKWSGTADCAAELLPASRLRRAKSYLDWVMPALLRHPDAAMLLPEGEEQKTFRAEPSAWKISCMTRDEALRETAQEQKIAEAQRNFFAAWESPTEVSAERQEVFRILSRKYPYGKEARLPAKLSISEIKRKYQEEELPGEAPLSAHREIEFPAFAQGERLSAAGIGTAMHTFMEEADFHKVYTEEDIAGLAEELVQRGRLTAEESRQLRKKELLQFFRSTLAERLRNAESIERERPFSMLMQPRELFFGEEYRKVTDDIVVNGIFDCFFVENGAGILLDYKSDRIYDEKELRERYCIQMKLYRMALERTLGIPVKEVYLYSFAMGKAILVE